jgi:CHAT domain-containing protein
VDVTAVALPIATKADRGRLRAASLDAIGCRAYPAIEKGQESAETFEAAARLHEENGDYLREGLARLHAAGARYTRLTDWARAAELAAVASQNLDRADAPEYAAMALRIEGAALDQQANASHVKPEMRDRTLKLARNRLTMASDRLQELGNAYEAGYALNYRGVSFDVAGDRERASDDFHTALQLFRRANDGPAQALSLQSLALQSHEDGRIGDAIREFEEALALIPRDEDPENYAHTLHNSALPLRVMGRFNEAIARFYEAGRILRERGDRDGEARALHGLGTTLMFAGEPERASELLQSAIRLRGESGSKRERAVSLFVLGQLERNEGKFEQAIAHHEEALSLVTAPHDLAQARLSLARAFAAAGRSDDAQHELDEILGLTLPATHRYRGLALAELAELESLGGREDSSRQHFARALTILKSNDSDLDSARTLVRRGEAQLRAAKHANAIRDADAALRQFDAIGLQSLPAESRAAFRASYRDAVELRIAAFLAHADGLRQSGNEFLARRATESALSASDRARARLVAETLSDRQASVPEDVRRRRDGIYQRLAGKRSQRERLQNAADADKEAIASLTREIALLRTEALLVEGEISSARGPAESRTFNETGENLTALLPEGHVVAEYFLGRKHAWLFEVRKGRVEVHAIADGDDIARLARELHLAWRKPGSTQRDQWAASDTLANALFRPLDDLGADETLYVIPDGQLHLIPMTVLAEHALPHASPGSVQVASTLTASLQPRTAESARAKHLLAVIADPIYSPDDSRIGGAATAVPVGDNVLTRSALNLERMKRLPAAALEAKAIVSLLGDEVALVLAGADASRQRVATAGLGQYRIVHFATHAIADSQDPALGLLALSRFDQGGKRMDGAFRALDIAELRLHADLVVLSACDTAVGREIAGEAPLGLSHAFLRSGAKAVLATLWQVPDTSTALLMREFYREMLVNARTPAAALALAQRHIRGQARWSDPYYWAGFQLTSNSRLGTNKQ